MGFVARLGERKNCFIMYRHNENKLENFLLVKCCLVFGAAWKVTLAANKVQVAVWCELPEKPQKGLQKQACKALFAMKRLAFFVA